ncbi:MAG: cytoplasmic protein [Rhizobiaceae bacterium]|nr:cytoplasmic protein [Rhizobiaceae bacterium]
MHHLIREACSFGAGRAEAAQEAAERAALQILCGLDLDAVLRASVQGLSAAIQRAERALRTERIKGLRRHWSYDLNRHIALKQAIDRLRARQGPK